MYSLNGHLLLATTTQVYRWDLDAKRLVPVSRLTGLLPTGLGIAEGVVSTGRRLFAIARNDSLTGKAYWESHTLMELNLSAGTFIERGKLNAPGWGGTNNDNGKDGGYISNLVWWNGKLYARVVFGSDETDRTTVHYINDTTIETGYYGEVNPVTGALTRIAGSAFVSASPQGPTWNLSYFPYGAFSHPDRGAFIMKDGFPDRGCGDLPVGPFPREPYTGPHSGGIR